MLFHSLPTSVAALSPRGNCHFMQRAPRAYVQPGCLSPGPAHTAHPEDSVLCVHLGDCPPDPSSSLTSQGKPRPDCSSCPGLLRLALATLALTYYPAPRSGQRSCPRNMWKLVRVQLLPHLTATMRRHAPLCDADGLADPAVGRIHPATVPGLRFPAPGPFPGEHPVLHHSQGRGPAAAPSS